MGTTKHRTQISLEDLQYQALLEILEIAKRYADELKKAGIKPQRIILYGSYAKGQPREESDIDFIVISEDFKNMNFRERLELLGIAAGRVFEPIEAIGYTSEEFEKNKKESFLEEIAIYASDMIF